MNIEQLSAFVSVVDQGTFTRAAEEQFISESALSHRIAGLEAELGFSLFSRKRGVRRIDLTDEGRRLVPLARQMLALWAQAKALGETTHEVLRLAAAHSMQANVLPDVLSLFSSREGAPQLYIMATNSRNACELVSRNEVDFALVNSITDATSTMYKELVAREDMVFVSGMESPYASEVGVAQISPADEVYLAWNDLIDLWHARWFGSASARIRLDSTTTVPKLFEEQEDRWALLPASVAEDLARRGRVRASKLDHPAPARDIWFLSTPSSPVEYHDQLLDDLRQVLLDKDGFLVVG